MAKHLELPEALQRIRNKYPVAKCAGENTWARIDELASSGDPEKIKEAEQIAHDCTMDNPRLRARHSGAIQARANRRKFLKVQKGFERAARALFADAGDDLGAIVSRAANDDGIVTIGKTRRLGKLLKVRHTEMWADYARLLRKQVNQSARLGIQGAQTIAAASLNTAKKEKQTKEGYAIITEALAVLEAQPDPFKQLVKFNQATSIFKKIFKGTLRATMKAGMFGKTGVSNRVWDLRNENLTRLNRIVTSGIANGKSAASISRDIRGLLRQPLTLRGRALDAARPGRGVYRSAFKNAMRVTRTETNRAFVNADAAFAKEKQWNLIWLVSTGQRERDECLIKGTMIRTTNGDIEIESIKKGDVVLTHRNRWRPVTRIFKNKIRDQSLMKLCFQEGKNRTREIFCTPNHPFLIEGEWIQARDLKMGCRGISLPLSMPARPLRTWRGASGTVEQCSERNGKLQYVGSTVSGLYDALLSSCLSRLHSVQTCLYPIDARLSDVGNYTGFSRQNSLGFLSRALQSIASCGLPLASQTYSDAFSRNLDYLPLSSGRTGLSNEPVLAVFLKNYFCKSGKSDFLSDEQKSDKPENSISDQDHYPVSGIPSRTQGIDSGFYASSTAQSIACCRKDGGNEQTFSPRASGMVIEGFLRRILGIISSCIKYTAFGTNMPQLKLIAKDAVKVEDEFVYNFEVESDNSYFANGVAVHNCDSNHGKEFTPDQWTDIYPLHPHDLCYSTLAIPQVG